MAEQKLFFPQSPRAERQCLEFYETKFSQTQGFSKRKKEVFLSAREGVLSEKWWYQQVRGRSGSIRKDL